jgi:hypothetical protein
MLTCPWKELVSVIRIIEFLDFFRRPIKTKTKRLKITSFESGLCSCLQVNNKNRGGRGVINLINWVPLSELISNTPGNFFFFYPAFTTLYEFEPPHSGGSEITHSHTTTVERTPLDE